MPEYFYRDELVKDEKFQVFTKDAVSGEKQITGVKLC
jgi:hypothetical protein